VIGVPQFVLALRETLGREMIEWERRVVGGAIDLDNVDATALRYVDATSYLRGLRKAREIIDDMVKQANAGEV
jgi:hypothetical protein